MDWRVDAGKRRTRERTVHGNEKDLDARACARGYGVALRADLWFHDAASNNGELYRMDFLPYYRITTRYRFDGAIRRVKSFRLARENFSLSPS